MGCRIGDQVLLEGDVVQIGENGPLVRVATAISPFGSSIYFTPARDSIAKTIAAVPAAGEDPSPPHGRI